MALTTAFVTAVRRQGSIPSSYASTDVLAHGDLEIQSVFVPLLEQVRQNFLIREVTSAPDARGRVPLPARAVGAALRSVQMQVGTSWVSLPQRAIEEVDTISSGQPVGYYLDAGSVAFLPQGSSATVRLRYAARPGAMVLDTDTSKCARINTVTYGATNTALAVTTYTGSTTIDVVAAGPAHQQKAIGTTYSTPNVPTADLIEVPAVGDYIVQADSSPFVPLPEELFAALTHRTAGVILRALGYDDEAQVQLSLAAEAIQRAVPMLSPRNEGNPQRMRGGIRRALKQMSSWRLR